MLVAAVAVHMMGQRQLPEQQVAQVAVAKVVALLDLQYFNLRLAQVAKVVVAVEREPIIRPIQGIVKEQLAVGV
jgi:hypothetical protein